MPEPDPEGAVDRADELVLLPVHVQSWWSFSGRGDTFDHRHPTAALIAHDLERRNTPGGVLQPTSLLPARVQMVASRVARLSPSTRCTRFSSLARGRPDKTRLGRRLAARIGKSNQSRARDAWVISTSCLATRDGLVLLFPKRKHRGPEGPRNAEGGGGGNLTRPRLPPWVSATPLGGSCLGDELAIADPVDRDGRGHDVAVTIERERAEDPVLYPRGEELFERRTPAFRRSVRSRRAGSRSPGPPREPSSACLRPMVGRGRGESACQPQGAGPTGSRPR